MKDIRKKGDPNIKKCTQCGEKKSVSEFPEKRHQYKPASNIRYYRSWCRPCQRIKQKIYNQRNYQKNIGDKEVIYRKRLRQKTITAVKSGVIKIKPCEVCGTEENVEMHHPDYSDYLNVVFLCKEHHENLHHDYKVPVKI